MAVKGDPYRQAVTLFRTLSHPVRLRILDELRRGEACVCHLQAAVRRPQAYVSQQLRVLREAGVIESRRSGLYIFYRIADPLVQWVLEETLGPTEERVPIAGCPCPQCAPDGAPMERNG